MLLFFFELILDKIATFGKHMNQDVGLNGQYSSISFFQTSDAYKSNIKLISANLISVLKFLFETWTNIGMISIMGYHIVHSDIGRNVH